MNRHAAGWSYGLQLATLCCASLMVPWRARPEWWKEWRSELWHVREAGTAGHEVTAFCRGAFADALCLRRQGRAKRVRLATTMGSPIQCLVLLAAIAMVSFGVALTLPGVRSELRPMPYLKMKNVMLLQEAQSRVATVATVDGREFHAWKRRPQELFDNLAFYRVAQDIVQDGAQPPARLAVAHASPNLLSMLGLPVRMTSAEKLGTLPRIVLSDAAWMQNFGSDEHISGRVVRIGGSNAVVAGVASEQLWRLPGKVDAWMMEPDETIPAKALGFSVVHVAPMGERTLWPAAGRLSGPKGDGRAVDLVCLAPDGRGHGPWGTFWFMVLLAMVALPATTSLPLGEYRLSSQRVSWGTQLRRWSFLVGKVGLLLPIVALLSLDVAHLRASFAPETSVYLQVVSTFVLCLFGLRWALRDQRQRCPVCLGKLTHPARVGQPSRNFLAWNGTELICVDGHGLLHIPEIATSWFSTQRWLYLDPSWAGLFVEPGLVSAGYF